MIRSDSLGLTRGIVFAVSFAVGLVAIAGTLRAQGPTCKSGFIWREARATDFVCVTPESRARVAQENRTASSRIQPGGGASGPFTCLSGFVWREAFDGDLVCVTPEVRTLVQQENSVAASRQQ